VDYPARGELDRPGGELDPSRVSSASPAAQSIQAYWCAP